MMPKKSWENNKFSGSPILTNTFVFLHSTFFSQKPRKLRKLKLPIFPFLLKSWKGSNFFLPVWGKLFFFHPIQSFFFSSFLRKFFFATQRLRKRKRRTKKATLDWNEKQRGRRSVTTENENRDDLSLTLFCHPTQSKALFKDEQILASFFVLSKLDLPQDYSY